MLYYGLGQAAPGIVSDSADRTILTIEAVVVGLLILTALGASRFSPPPPQEDLFIEEEDEFSTRDWLAFGFQLSAVAASAYYGWKAGKDLGGTVGGVAGLVILPPVTNHVVRFALKKTVLPVYLMTEEQIETLQKVSEGQLT